MTPGPHVFGDGRVGLWNVNPASLVDRLPKIKAFGGGSYFTDMFLPGVKAQPGHVRAVRNAGLYANIYMIAGASTARAFTDLCLERIAALQTGALEANVEVSDPVIEPYCREFLTRFRVTRPNYRIRLNIAWRKAGFLPIDLLVDDPNLYVAEQCYVDAPSMNPTSSADALQNLLDAGVPIGKASVCYGAAGPVGGDTGSMRVGTLPTAWAPRRGVVFQDDLMAEVGYL